MDYNNSPGLASIVEQTKDTGDDFTIIGTSHDKGSHQTGSRMRRRLRNILDNRSTLHRQILSSAPPISTGLRCSHLSS